MGSETSGGLESCCSLCLPAGSSCQELVSYVVSVSVCWGKGVTDR